MRRPEQGTVRDVSGKQRRLQSISTAEPHHEQFAGGVRPPIVGIFGAGRNGTTLLMRLLDGSPDLWVYPIELNYFSVIGSGSLRARVKQLIAGRRLATPREAGGADFGRWAARQIGELEETYVRSLAEPIEIDQDNRLAIVPTVERSNGHDLLGYLEAVRRAYDDRGSSASPVHVFKSIEVSRLPRYRERFPQMRFLHIVRHPWTNYASLKRSDIVRKRKPFWYQGGDLLRTQLEDRWVPHVRFILEERGQDPARHFVVKYEELCVRPEAVVEDICRWLGVRPPPDLTLLTVLGGKRMIELPDNPSMEGVTTPARVVASMAAEFGYQDVLTEREREFIALRTGGLGLRLGYWDWTENFGAWRRLKLAWSWLPADTWETVNVTSQWRFAAAVLRRRWYILTKLLTTLD